MNLFRLVNIPIIIIASKAICLFEIFHRTMLVQSKTFQAQRVHVGEYSLSEGKSTSSSDTNSQQTYGP